MTTDHLSTVSCSTCSHFVVGHCRRHPPMTIHGGWPRIESPKVEWCGEHKPVDVVSIGDMANGKYERATIVVDVEPTVAEPEPIESTEPAPVLSFTSSPRSKRPKSS